MASTKNASHPKGNQAAAEAVKRKRLTNITTDTTCLKKENSAFHRFLYMLEVESGIYNLRRTERNVLSVVTVFCSISAMLYLAVFFTGFLDGFRHLREGAQEEH